MLAFSEKLVDEILPRGVRFDGLAAGEKIVAQTVVVTIGTLLVDQVQRQDNLIAFIVEGGTANRGNVVRCEAVTSAGNLYALDVLQIVR